MSTAEKLTEVPVTIDGITAAGITALLGSVLCVSVQAQETRTLTVCVQQPLDYIGAAPYPLLPGSQFAVKAGKVTSLNPSPSEGGIDTTTCQTRRFPRNSAVIIRARTLSLGNEYQQAGFEGWGETGSIYPEGQSGPTPNVCKNLGTEPVCNIRMNVNRYVRADFTYTDPDRQWLWDDGDDLPVCEIVSLDVNSPKGLCVVSNGKRKWMMEFDLNKSRAIGEHITTIFYQDGFCTSGPTTEGTVHYRIYNGSGPDNTSGLEFFHTSIDGGDSEDEMYANSMYTEGLGCTTLSEQYEFRGTEVRWGLPRGVTSTLGGSQYGGDVGYSIR